MIQTQIRFANSESEVNIATEVAAKSFYPKIEDNEKAESLKSKWRTDPFCSKEYLLVALYRDEIVGGLRTTPFTILRMSQEYSCLGIAEIFVSMNFQGLGIASHLVDHLISSTKDSKYDMILGVARKKIDGFYLKKGFYGIGSYPEIRINGIRESNKFRSLKSDSFAFHKVTIDESMNSLYETCYENVFGRQKRSKADWKKINRENLQNGNLCLGIFLRDELVGYLIICEKSILEISFRDYLNQAKLIIDLAEFLQVNELKFEISSSHSLLSSDLGFDITTSTRECFYGGHIAKIANLESVVKKFIEREYETLSSSEDEKIEIMIGSDHLQIDLNKRTIKKSSLDSSPELFAPQWIEFDSISFDTTKLLLGIKGVYSEFRKREYDFSSEPFVISTIDEF